MTKEEQAIEYIKTYRELDENLYNIAPKGTVSSRVTKKCLEFWDMAIEALEAQFCEDCVSREAVQDLIAKLLSDYLHDEDREKIENVNAEIGELPSVQPQRKRGKWIKIGKDSRGYTDTFECSECGELIRFMFYMDDCEYDYCPYCLADMRGDTDETN